MSSIAGSTCVMCQSEIHTAVEGMFCPKCGKPAHHRCMTPMMPSSSSDACSDCGASMSDDRYEIRTEPRAKRIAMPNAEVDRSVFRHGICYLERSNFLVRAGELYTLRGQE